MGFSPRDSGVARGNCRGDAQRTDHEHHCERTFARQQGNAPCSGTGKESWTDGRSRRLQDAAPVGAAAFQPPKGADGLQPPRLRGGEGGLPVGMLDERLLNLVASGPWRGSRGMRRASGRERVSCGWPETAPITRRSHGSSGGSPGSFRASWRGLRARRNEPRTPIRPGRLGLFRMSLPSLYLRYLIGEETVKEEFPRKIRQNRLD